jgi:hypothetical protein
MSYVDDSVALTASVIANMRAEIEGDLRTLQAVHRQIVVQLRYYHVALRILSVIDVGASPHLMNFRNALPDMISQLEERRTRFVGFILDFERRYNDFTLLQAEAARSKLSLLRQILVVYVPPALSLLRDRIDRLFDERN